MRIYTKEELEKLGCNDYGNKVTVDTEYENYFYYTIGNWSNEETEILWNYSQLIGKEPKYIFVWNEDVENICNLKNLKREMQQRRYEDHPYWMIEQTFLDECINNNLITIENNNNNDNNLQLCSR